MSTRVVPLVEGEFYHIYNRGNSKQQIFFDDTDYARFVKLLYICNSIKQINFRDDIIQKGIDVWDFDSGETLVSIGSWVLMPNHFHIYLTCPSPEAGLRGGLRGNNNITIFMHKLCTSYSKYINTKYERTGTLFEGRFKSVHINEESQAKYLFSYIHLNPIKLIDKNWKIDGIKNWPQAKQFLDKYEWSSYLDYKGILRSEGKILNVMEFPEYFQNIEDFENEIESWLNFNTEDK